MLRKIYRKIRRMMYPDSVPMFLNKSKRLAQHDIGEWTYGRVIVHAWRKCGKLKIGKFCSLSTTQIFLGGEHRIDWATTYAFPTLFANARKFTGFPRLKGDTTIGNDVWIGEDSIIMSGVAIGDGSVIGARCLVRKDVPPYAIVAGNPARVTGYRFEKEIIEQLLQIAWWDWPIEKIEEALPLMLNADIEAFVEKYRVE
jgi:virginiamycin A acetyltransferase